MSSTIFSNPKLSEAGYRRALAKSELGEMDGYIKILHSDPAIDLCGDPTWPFPRGTVIGQPAPTPKPAEAPAQPAPRVRMRDWKQQ